MSRVGWYDESSRLGRVWAESGPVVLKEMRMPTPEGIRKPGLIQGLVDKDFVMDTQVVVDNSCLKEVITVTLSIMIN